MNEIKFKILTEFKTSLPIHRATDFRAYIQYENGTKLEKSNIEITNAAIGEGLFKLSAFEIQGLAVGNGVPFILEFVQDSKSIKVLFSNALNIVQDEITERKSII